MLSLLAASAAADPIQWTSLGLKPGIELGFFTLRFYSLAYLLGVIFAYWHTSRALKEPGAPMFVHATYVIDAGTNTARFA